jgi:hypothetical protein
MYQPVQGRLRYPEKELVVTVFLMTITYRVAKNIILSTILFTLTSFLESLLIPTMPYVLAFLKQFIILIRMVLTMLDTFCV